MSIVSQAVLLKVKEQVKRTILQEFCIDDLSHSNRIVPVYAMQVMVRSNEPSWVLVLGNKVLNTNYFSKVAAELAWTYFREKNNLTSIRKTGVAA